MIEINLLPEELRKREPFKFNLSGNYLKNIALPAIVIFILVNALIPLLIISKSVMLKQVKSYFLSIQPQVKQIDEISLQVHRFKAQDDVFSRLIKARLTTAVKLSAISDCLSQGVWLSELWFSKDILEIKGSCVSAEAQEMAQIGKFLNALKADKQIGASFIRLELASVQRRKLGATEVVDFIINSNPQVQERKKK